MPNYLAIPDDLLPLIEKRGSSERRVSKRRYTATQKLSISAGDPGATRERRKMNDRRKKPRRRSR